MNESVLDLAKSICEEYVDEILIDDENFTILIYVSKEFYSPICVRLAQLNFVEFFKYKKEDSLVVCYQLLHDDLEEYEFIDEADGFFDEDDEDDGQRFID